MPQSSHGRPTAIIDLFSGAGGFSWGWRRAGFRTAAAVDHDAAAARTHELNFGSEHCLSLNRDLTTFGPDALASLLNGIPRDLLAVTGGPPCQGWSRAGRGKLRSLKGDAASLLKDPRNSLYRQFLAYVSHFAPPVAVMENVPGMLRLEGRSVADEILEHFRGIGYDATYALVNARWFGVPQDRTRLIFLAVREDLDLDLHAVDLEDFAQEFRKTHLALPGETTVRQAIHDVPVIPHDTQEDPQPYIRRSGRLSRYASIMRTGSNGIITDHITRRHNEQDLEAFRVMPEGGLYIDLPDHLKRYRDDIFPDKYRKLRWDSVAGTVTAHLAKDGYSHIHPQEHRTLSIREAARLQSFPDSFRFAGNIGDRFRQIGNAVPPLMAWGIAAYVRRQLDEWLRDG
jgi:DNA (cytosine-5)-methyltransferase 1